MPIEHAAVIHTRHATRLVRQEQLEWQPSSAPLLPRIESMNLIRGLPPPGEVLELLDVEIGIRSDIVRLQCIVRQRDCRSVRACQAPRLRRAAMRPWGVWFGEAAGLIGAVEPASVIVERMAVEAADLLGGRAGAALA
jgi:hypothetical protein